MMRHAEMRGRAAKVTAVGVGLLVAVGCGASDETVPLPTSDDSSPSLTLCVNVQDPQRDELCDGTSVDAGGQDLTLEGPEEGDITLIAAATDSESGIADIRILTQSHRTRCSTEDPNIGIETRPTYVPITDTDTTTYAAGDDVPVSRSIAYSWTTECGGAAPLGYTISFLAEATSYLGTTVRSQIIVVVPEK